MVPKKNPPIRLRGGGGCDGGGEGEVPAEVAGENSVPSVAASRVATVEELGEERRRVGVKPCFLEGRRFVAQRGHKKGRARARVG